MGYKNGLVVFIDVLGTRSTPDFDRKLFIHNLWHDSAKDIEERGSLFEEMRTLERKVFSFSDCAYYIYTFNERASKERRNSMAAFNEVLQSLASVLQKIMEKGFFIRGGATLGDVYVDNKGMFGPAVERAYELESKCAIYPRIILEDNLGSNISDYMLNNYTPGAQPIIYKDEDFYFLNMFYGFEVDINCGLTWEEFSRKISNYAKNTICNIENSNIGVEKKDKIKQKMRWMLNAIQNENKKIYIYKQVFEKSFL